MDFKGALSTSSDVCFKVATSLRCLPSKGAVFCAETYPDFWLQAQVIYLSYFCTASRSRLSVLALVWWHFEEAAACSEHWHTSPLVESTALSWLLRVEVIWKGIDIIVKEISLMFGGERPCRCICTACATFPIFNRRTESVLLPAGLTRPSGPHFVACMCW
jgi:hypothetical protein